MIRLNHVTRFALAALVVLAVAAGYASHQMARARDSYKAEVAMQKALASVRRLQIATRALQSERAALDVARHDWEEARTEFRQTLGTLDAALGMVLPDRPQLRRIDNTWTRMAGVYEQINSALIRLDQQGLLTRLGYSSLAVAYEEMLAGPRISDRDLGDVGLLFFQLERVDGLVIEIEFELRDLARALEVSTQSTVRSSISAATIALAVAVAIVGVLLFRIARLYSSLETDNAARRAAERAARASEGDLSITLNSIGDAVLATDTAGKLVRLNPAAVTLIGWSVAEALGRPVRELFRLTTAGTNRQAHNPVDRVLSSGQVAELDKNLVLERRDGTERTVSAVATPICDERQTVRGVVLVVRDVTESARLEEQLRRAQKVESLGQLAGGVAHDFNNILQVIKANLSFLGETAWLKAEEREYIGQIDSAANRAGDLTRQLLALGRRQSLQMTVLDPAEVVRDVLKLVRRVIGENIEVGFAAENDLDWVHGDHGQLEQVLINLCVNARDAMPDGGSLALRLVNTDISVEQAQSWAWARQGRYVRLEVSDTGVGMAPETLAHVFEPFFTTKPEGTGTGLGLSVVQSIIHQHDGFINVFSQKGRGTTFQVHLPGQPRPEVVAPALGAVRGAISSAPKGETVLLVEDEAAVRQSAQTLLSHHGYRVLVAADGLEAVAIGAAHGAEIRVAILDVMMPRLGGVEAARQLRLMRPGLPIVLCTGHAGNVTIPELERDPGWRLITKPYATDEFLRVVRMAIHGTSIAATPGHPS